MKRLHFIAASAIAVTLLLGSCSKEATLPKDNQLSNESYRNKGLLNLKGDRIDEILRDLKSSDYSLTFQKAYPEHGISRTSYGDGSFLHFADPKKLGFNLNYDKVPIWKIPKMIVPTCPDMAIDIHRLDAIKDILAKADVRQFGALQTINFLGGGGFLADEQHLAQYKNAQPDKIDELTKDLSLEKFLILNLPGKSAGHFTRSFYGTADLNKIILKPGQDLREILKPTLKGCFDPVILDAIRERLQKFDPVAFGGLAVRSIDQNVAVMY